MSSSPDAHSRVIETNIRRNLTAALPSPRADAASGRDEASVEYGRFSEGWLVARVAETAFAMTPARNGGYYLATGWRLSRPMNAWTRADF